MLESMSADQQADSEDCGIKILEQFGKCVESEHEPIHVAGADRWLIEIQHDRDQQRWQELDNGIRSKIAVAAGFSYCPVRYRHQPCSEQRHKHPPRQPHRYKFSGDDCEQPGRPDCHR